MAHDVTNTTDTASAREALNILHTAFAGYADTAAKREAVALAEAALSTQPSDSDGGAA